MNLTPQEVESFTLVLYEKFGLDFTCYEPKSLQRRINKVLHVLKCSNTLELWNKILKDNNLLSVFMDELSVGLTSMFRDPSVWSTLRAILFDKQDSNLSVWNAGCSTGEEVYTLAIVLREINMANKVKIHATDMNRTAISIAKSGIYHKIKIAEYSNKYKEYNKFGQFDRFYKKFDDNHVQMDDSLISNVRFNYHNLVTDPFLNKYDLIFCRNVMIYFDQQMKNKLLEKFYQALNPGGYLIIGFYDSLLPESERSKYNVDLAKLRIFKKLA